MTTQRDWWDRVEGDLDSEDDDDLEDFDSEDFWSPQARASSDYLDSMWSRSGFGRAGRRVDNVMAAHGMVQGFVNAFARDARYRVVFDEAISTAGTDMQQKIVKITPAPALDEELTPTQAGQVLTGLACHEICHPRYGSSTYWAVKKVFPGSAVAEKISNMLDDVRIEQRFIGDYPGYSGVFDPTLDYVAKGLQKRVGSEQWNGLIRPSPLDPINLMIAAIRYPGIAAWDGIETERDWWQKWVGRHGKEGAPSRHVAAVREALRHIVDTRSPRPKDEDQGDQSGDAPGAGDEDDETDDEDAANDGQATGSDQQPDEDESIDADGLDGAGVGEPEPDADGDEERDGDESKQAEADSGSLTDEELAELADKGVLDTGQSLSICLGSEAVEAAAKEQGVDSYEAHNMAAEVQQQLEDELHLEDNGEGTQIDVARSLKGLINSRLDTRRAGSVAHSEAAARAIRDAILRSRTGRTEVNHYQNRGRVDNHALHRIAQQDFRLFDRRRAQSPGRYLIWVMVDKSSSMNGAPTIQTAEVATAFARALQHVKTVRMEVWAWSDQFRHTRNYYSYRAGVARAWQTGQPVSEISRMVDLQSGGTPDSAVLAWAWRAIRREVRGDEVPVIFFLSDGFGNYGNHSMEKIVEEATKAGVLVRGVAIGYAVSEEELRKRFGQDNYVSWQGSIVSTAKPLGRMIARLVGRDKRRQS